MKPIPPHSGLTSLQGGNASNGEYYHFTQPEHDYLLGVASGNTTISATTFYVGNTPLTSILSGSTTYVQPGLNITTGGTASLPVINLAGSISLTGVTATTINSDNYYSAGTSLNDIIGNPARTYRKRVDQVDHGFSIGHMAYLTSDDTYARATNASYATCSVAGMVTEVFDTDTFEITSEGYIDFSYTSTILPSLTAGKLYYLTSASGTFAEAPPAGEYQKAIFLAVNDSALYILNGTEIKAPNTMAFSLFREEAYIENIPALPQFLVHDVYYPFRYNIMNLQDKTQIRITAYVATAATKGDLLVRYSLTDEVNFKVYSPIGDGPIDVTASIESTGLADSGWRDITADALQGDIYFGWGTINGDGTGGPVIMNGMAYFR